MQKYQENLAARINGNNLQPLAGASVTVTNKTTGLPASLYADDGTTPLAQPLITDNAGSFAFRAADGTYVLTFSGVRFATFTKEIVLDDPLENPYATLAQLATPSGATLINYGDTPISDILDQHSADIESLALGAAGVSWASATFPLYAAHRGMEMAFPENTMKAFQEAVNAGAGSIEMDCYLMADGRVAVMHDQLTARTCRLTDGTSISLDIETLSSFDLYGLDASYKTGPYEFGFNGSDFESNAVPLLQDVLATLKGKAILLLEAKGSTTAKRLANAQAIADLVDKLKMQAAVVIQSIHKLPTSGVDLKGCKWAFVTTSAQMTSTELNDLAYTNGCYMVIMDKAGIDVAYKALVNSKGMKLCGYTYSRPDELATVVPDIVLATDTTIVSGKRLAGGRDALMRKYPGPGYTRDGFGGAQANALIMPVIRTIGTRRAIGWPAAAPISGRISRTVICCLDPDPNNDGNYTLDFDVIWTEIDAAPAGFCFISVELDKAATLAENDANSITKRGYSIGFRATGAAAMYRLAGTTPTATSIATATGLPNPPVINQAYPCRIVVSATSVVATFDVGGLNITMTANDTTYRNGKYLQVERRGHGFMIANLRVS